ncbi:hypothetical protein ACHWQZ_G004145 [Mnemiopsis leidyi]
MFSLGADDDDLDFTPNSGAGLMSLFGKASSSSPGGKSDSLKFSAPKQPKPEPKTDSGTGSGVLFASVCQTYLYQDNTYNPKGKLGVALTGSKSVIIYGQKQRVVSNCKLAADTQFTITAANFLTYYDDVQQCWGVMFSGDNDLETFLMKVSVVKFGFGQKLLKQQINFVKDTSRTVGGTDSVTVAYNGHLIDNDQLGVQFDTNDSFQVKLSAPTVIKGWVESLPDCVETGVYCVCIPAVLAYGDKGIPNRIPANSDLVFKITIKQISRVTVAAAPKSPSSVSQNLNDFTDSSSVDSLPTPKKNVVNGPQKNEILSRMARMGAQQAMPTASRVASSPDQDEPEIRSRTSSLKSNRSKRKTRSSSSIVSEEKPPQIPAKPGPLVPHFTNAGFPAAAFSGFSTVTPQMIAPPEIKENLDISKNVDKSVTAIEASLKEMEAKLNVLSEQAIFFNSTVANCPTVDTQLLMYNLQRIVSENENLKADLKKKTITLEERSGKITELLNKNQELLNLKNEALEMSQNNFIATSTNSSNEIQRLENENEQLKNELKVFKSSSNNRQFEIDAKQDQINALKSQMETMYTENNKLQTNLFETRNELSALRLTSSDTGGQEVILQREITKLKERVQSSLVEKLEISQQLDDQVFKEKQMSMKFEKKIRQLQLLLEESQSSNGNDSLVEENRKINEDLAKTADKLSEEKLKVKNLENELSEEKANSSKRLAEEGNRLSSREEEFRETICALNLEMASLTKDLEDRHRQIKSLAQELLDRDDQIKSLAQELEDRSAKSNEPSASTNDGNSKEMVNTKVKGILNLVFRQFKEKVGLDETYEGRDVLTLSMGILKDATLSLLSEGSEDSSASSAQEESDEESDDDNDDDTPDDGTDRNPNPEASNPIQTTNSTEFELPGAIGMLPHEQTQVLSPANNDSFYSAFEEGESSNDPREGRSTSTANQSAEEVLQNNSAAGDGVNPVQGDRVVAPDNPQQGLNNEEFEAREEEDLWMAAPPSEPPPSPAPATFEPTLQHNTVSVEDITHLSTEVFGAHPEEMTTSPSNTRREASSARRTDGPPPLFSDSEDDFLDICSVQL